MRQHGYSFFHSANAYLAGLTVIALLVIASAVQADIYKYVDKHGRVILTDRPKNSNYKRLVKTWKGWVEQPQYNLSSVEFIRNKKKFTPTVDYVAKRYNLPNSLLHAVITAESSYNPVAVSRAGAVGLMQLMPETARRYGVKDRLNPYENIHGGTRYLRDLLIMFENDLSLALAAYNAGENAVKKYGNTIPPYQETRNYVNKVIKYYKQYLNTNT
jgi:soluble lytic murein transglycosylase-like protein